MKKKISEILERGRKKKKEERLNNITPQPTSHARYLGKNDLG